MSLIAQRSPVHARCSGGAAGAPPGRPPLERYNKDVPSCGISGDIMTSTKNFWPLDYDPEEEIYENLSWDLPGFKPSHRSVRPVGRQRRASTAARREAQTP